MAEVAIDIRKKLDIFQDKIMGRVDEQCAAIAQEVEEFRKQELEKYLNDVLGDTRKYLASEINEIITSSAKEVYNKKVAFKKQLFDKRDAYCRQVFQDVREQLKSYTTTEAYKDFLRDKARGLGERYGSQEVTLLVRPGDLALAADLKQAFGGSCAVKSTEEIALGGIILSNAQGGYRVDESLDTALNNQKQRFYAQSGMIVSL